MELEYRIGVDEAGRGACIGSLFIGIVGIPLAKRKKLNFLGLKDSKTLSRSRIRYFANAIHTYFDVTILEITASEIDDSSITLDALIFSKIREHIKKEVPAENTQLIFDQIGSTNTFKTGITCHFPYHEISVFAKADSIFPEVMAAGIVAKNARENQIESLNSGRYREMGSGYPSDVKTVSFLKSKSNDLRSLSEVRFSWKNVQEILK